MAKIKVESQSTGTGIYTLKTGTASTNYSATLPDATGTLSTEKLTTKGDLEVYGTAPDRLAVGTNDYLLTADSTAANGVAWKAAAGGGLYASVAIICDEKATLVDGGTFTSGAWRTRDLNTEISDADGIVSISTNQFTLQAGTYTIHARAPFYKTDQTAARLQNITDGTTTQEGSTSFSRDTTGEQIENFIDSVFTIAGAKAFEIQQRGLTTVSTTGFGNDNKHTDSIYTVVTILKHS